MHIALIPPKGYAGMLSHLTRFQLVVPSQFNSDTEKILQHHKEQGHYIILDNGVFEGDAYSIEELLSKAAPFASEIVLPDVFKDADATYQKVMENVINVIKPANQQKYFRFMIVPQGKDEIEWLDNFFKLYNELAPYSQDYVWGMPKWLGKNDPERRARILQLVSLHSTFVTWHMLGCNSIEELRQLTFVELQGFAIRSMDTSLPFKIAAAGSHIDRDLEAPFESSEYFKKRFTHEELELGIINSVDFLSVANYKQYKVRR